MPGDQQVVSASRDRTIRIFDVASTCVLCQDYDMQLYAYHSTDIWYGPYTATPTGYDVLNPLTTADGLPVVRVTMYVFVLHLIYTDD